MVNPTDTAPDTLQPQLDQPEFTAPQDHEAVALEPGIRHVAPLDENERDKTALADSPVPRPDGGDAAPVEAERRRPEPRVAQDLGIQAMGRAQPAADTPAKVEQEPADDTHDTARTDDYELAIQRVGANAVSATTVVEAAGHGTEAAHVGDGDDTKHEAAASAATGTEKEVESAADAGQPPRPPDDPHLPVGGPGDEDEPEGRDEPAAGREPREVATAATGASGETSRIEKGTYNVDGVAQLFGVSYGGVRDVIRRSDSLLSFQNVPEPSIQRVANLPAPYVNALRDYQQQNGITSFKKAADRFASTLEGQSLAYGLRAEHDDRIREYERAQRGYLTLGQAGELMNVGTAYLTQHGLVSDVPPPPADEQTGRVETFVRPRGVSGDTVRQTMEWTHSSFADPMQVPETGYLASSEVEKILGCSRRAIIQMSNHGYIPNWRFESDSGESNRKYPQEFVEGLGEYLRTHNRLDLIEAAEQYAHEHADAHTLIRGQFEMGLHRLAIDGDGFIPRQQLADHLHLAQGQFWRIYGTKPDARGYPLEYVRSRITWSGAEIADRELATVDARGRQRWQVSAPGIKEQILGEVAMGSVPTDVARSHGIPPRTVLGWVEASKPRGGAPDTAGEQASEGQRARQPGTSKEELARAFEQRAEQQEADVTAASEGLGAEAARRIIVDSGPAARQFVRWIADNEQSLMHVAASREDIDPSQIAAQIQVARLLAEQHRFYPADMLVGAKVFDDLRPLAQAMPPKTDENPEERPIMTARQIAALRLATKLAREGRLAYFPETGV